MDLHWTSILVVFVGTFIFHLMRGIGFDLIVKIIKLKLFGIDNVDLSADHDNNDDSEKDEDDFTTAPYSDIYKLDIRDNLIICGYIRETNHNPFIAVSMIHIILKYYNVLIWDISTYNIDDGNKLVIFNYGKSVRYVDDDFNTINYVAALYHHFAFSNHVFNSKELMCVSRINLKIWNTLIAGYPSIQLAVIPENEIYKLQQNPFLINTYPTFLELSQIRNAISKGIRPPSDSFEDMEEWKKNELEAYTETDVISIELDFDNNKLTYYLNNKQFGRKVTIKRDVNYKIVASLRVRGDQVTFI